MSLTPEVRENPWMTPELLRSVDQSRKNTTDDAAPCGQGGSERDPSSRTTE